MKGEKIVKKKKENFQGFVNIIDQLNNDKKKLTVTLQIRNGFIAYHFWKKAPEEVKFLRNPHRHLFSVISMIPVAGDDRELEFFTVQRSIQKFLRKEFQEKTFGYSCEQFATIIKQYIDKKYKVSSSIGVYEDGENGAIVS